MKLLIVGASGTLGQALVKTFKALDIEVITASRNSGDLSVDILSSESIEKMYQQTQDIDAVISATGKDVAFKTVSKLSHQDYLAALQNKLLGQINLVLIGQRYVNPCASFTLTSGILNHVFIPKGSCAACVNGAIDSFVQSAALEMPHPMRLNAVSPTLLKESKEQYKDYFMGFDGVEAQVISQAYVRSVMGILNGEVIKVW